MTQDVRNYIRYKREENTWTQEEIDRVEWRERNGNVWKVVTESIKKGKERWRKL